MTTANHSLLRELLQARENRVPCALVTVAAVRGSAPRAAGAKMIVYSDGRISGTVGGGKFESLVVEEALGTIREGAPVLSTYPLREDQPGSFGAICGGEVTVLIEPQECPPLLCLVGAGHCSLAIAKVARECGRFVTVIDDRAERLSPENFPEADRRVTDAPAQQFIAAHPWEPGDALVLVSRSFEIDRDALGAALRKPEIGYIGMIGSRRKVLRVFDELAAAGHSCTDLERVFAPIGLDIGADSPAEIAVSVMAEILKVQRGREGGHLRLRGTS
jgi:xanthine dehydrogenase accessory factor